MKIKLYDDTKFSPYPTKIQICLNRGIPSLLVNNYLKNSYENILPPEAFDEELLKKAAKRLLKVISEDKKAFLIQDSDCDGMTSAALLINYLYEVFPTWVENKLEYGIHEGKQHGINDFIDELAKKDYSLLLVPDAGTNDTDAINRLHELGCETIVLDHHLSDIEMSPYAIIINSQYNYPNNQLSGVGVVYKFCKYLDKLLNKDIADNFLDLVGIGLMGDMMDIRTLETKEMIFLGLKEENFKNPLIHGLREKSAFALSKSDYAPSGENGLAITPMGAAFFIIPLLNAICRSGTKEEKHLIFSSMLTMEAFKSVPSTKRGHKIGEMERIVDQALRTCTNVKNRQTKAEEAGMEMLTKRAEDMLDNKVLIFCLKDGEINPNIAGLVANKLASKYQRPVCVTRLVDDIYAGSMRGYTATGIDNFKEVAETSAGVDWVRGHENAAGICINDPDTFNLDMNERLKNISTEIVHWVDYIYDADHIDDVAILDMAEMNDYLGTGFARPMVYIEDCEISDYMIMKDSHLKINLPNNVSAIMWNIDEDFKDRLQSGEHIKINFVAKPNINEWNFQKYPQLIIEDFEEVVAETSVGDFLPAAAWGF